MYSQGYSTERISHDLQVTERMVFYYLKAWEKNSSYFIKQAKTQAMLSIRDEAFLTKSDQEFKDLLGPMKI